MNFIEVKCEQKKSRSKTGKNRMIINLESITTIDGNNRRVNFEGNKSFILTRDSYAFLKKTVEIKNRLVT